MARFNVFPDENGNWTNDRGTSSQTSARSGSSLSKSSTDCVRSSASGGSTLDSIINSLKNKASSIGGIDGIGASISSMTGSLGSAFESKINSSIQSKLNSVIRANASKVRVNVGDVENMLHLSQGGLTQKIASKIVPYDSITSSINGVINSAIGSISSKANIGSISKSVTNAVDSMSGYVANGISKRGK
jgi:hypothetical protein